MSLERKIFSLDILETKADGEEGPDFSGAASVSGVKDFYNEIIDPGAFTRTLKQKKGRIQMLADHMPDRRIGVGLLEDKEPKLKMDGFLNLDKQLSKDTLSDIRFNRKMKLPLGLSIGFETIKEDMDEDGLRHLKEIALWEVSVVTFPANPKALIANSMDGKFSLDLSSILKYLSRVQPDAANLCKEKKELIAEVVKKLNALFPVERHIRDSGEAHSLYGNIDYERLVQEADKTEISSMVSYLKNIRGEN